MQGIVINGYGKTDVLEKVDDLKQPTIKSDQVLVQVKASTFNIADYILFTKPLKEPSLPLAVQYLNKGLSFLPARVGGSEFAGIVTEVGADVTKFSVGQHVCGINFKGAWTEYLVINENALFPAPADFSFEQSAALPIDAVTAYSAVKKAVRWVGAKVLINGASGGVGHFALQIAKAFQAEVTAVCSTRNASLARKLGADHMIDYTQEDIADHPQKYDAIIAINGYQPLSKYRSLLQENGTYVLVGGKARQDIEGAAGLVFGDVTHPKITGAAYPFVDKKETMQKVLKLAANGKVVPHIDHAYSINEIPDALNYLVKQHAQGKVALKVDFSE
ncbi:NADPH:quinone reductase [Ligilactobacillus salitolerans]|uniref:NADPH:quinone reductase n=1 Tax=Ligilactobacillus salitolerans TaxID=1808352 RepID=A0A401IT93_9LACO|nr:NAD(P)-dependent alcohol dehydrogenase [Ligilactobacillus salitolerans]GBG94751.1 NADPH:quinone reductase [Ligilactobacillus salitolerans]